MMPWHRHVVDVLYEYDPDTGRQVYDTGDVFVMRQVGKTMGLITPAMVHRCTTVPHRLGRQRVTFTMHKRDKARAKLEKDIAPLLREAPESFREITNPKGRPGRSTREWRLSLNNGSENIQFGRGNYLQIDTPSKTAGHSDTLDMCAFDEIRFAPDDRVEQGVEPTMITRTDRLFVRASTAGDHESFYMWPLVLSGRRQCETGNHGNRAYFEYSLPEDADLHDPDVWYEYHPGVGHTIALRDLLGLLHAAENHPEPSKIDTFRQEHANQWVRTPVIGDGPREQIVPLDLWESRRAPESTTLVGDLALAVAVAPEGKSAAIAVAGRRPDGVPVVDVVSFDAGVFWLEARVADMRDVYGPRVVSYLASGHARAMSPEIGRGAGVVPVEPVAGVDYPAACDAFVLAVKSPTDDGRPPRILHMGQAWLDSAVRGAGRKHIGSRWVWDPDTSLADITPLEAVTVALRALEQLPPPERPVDPLSQVF